MVINLKREDFNGYTYYTYYFYFKIINDNNKNYLLIDIINEINGGTISHLNRPTPIAKESIRYNSLAITSSSYIYLNNTINKETNIYLSFSFVSDVSDISEYTIYLTMDDYFDDKAFKSLSSYKLTNPRIKYYYNYKYNYIYIFYLNYKIYDKSKKYICLKPGDVDGEKNLITIRELPKFPIELKQSQNLTINSGDFIFVILVNVK